MTARLIHGALMAGVVAFGAITVLVIRPSRPDMTLPPAALYVLLGVSLAATALGLGVLRGRVPRRVQEQSPDLYWQSALAPALVTWSAMEGGALTGVVGYFVGGSPAALAVAAVGLAAMIAMRPAHVERIWS